MSGCNNNNSETPGVPLCFLLEVLMVFISVFCTVLQVIEKKCEVSFAWWLIIILPLVLNMIKMGKKENSSKLITVALLNVTPIIMGACFANSSMVLNSIVSLVVWSCFYVLDACLYLVEVWKVEKKC